jgi:UDP-N-acetylglucosamine 2-epimerase (non-hydrolysing)
VLTKFHFAPTVLSRDNLLHEGVPAESIYVTGNTVIDALFDVLHKFKLNPLLEQTLAKQFPYVTAERRMILVTGHRRESFGEGFKQICHALKRIAERFPNVDIVYPVHLNPEVQKPVHSLLSSQSNIYLIDPVEYVSFVYLMRSSCFILTDSGGIQEEAPSLGKPVLVMRSRTERPEAVDAGTVKLVGTDVEVIVHEAARLLEDKKHYQKMAQAQNPYGDGDAASRIVRFLANALGDKTKKRAVREKEEIR